MLKWKFMNKSSNGHLCNNCKERTIETNTDINAIS